jgi:hypothetical protein
MAQINTRYLTLTNKPYLSQQDIQSLKAKLINEYNNDPTPINNADPTKARNPNRSFINTEATFQLPPVFVNYENHKFIKINGVTVSYIRWETSQPYITEHPQQPTHVTLHSNIVDYHEWNIVNTTDYGVNTYNYTTPEDYVMMCNTYLAPKIYHVAVNNKIITDNGLMKFHFQDFMGRNIPLIEFKYNAVNKLFSMFFLLFKIELELITHG